MLSLLFIHYKPHITITLSGIVWGGILLVVILYSTIRTFPPGFPRNVWLFRVTTSVDGERFSLRD